MCFSPFIFHVLSCKDSWNDLMCSFSTSAVDVDRGYYPIFDTSLSEFAIMFEEDWSWIVYWLLNIQGCQFVMYMYHKFPTLNLCMQFFCRLCIQSSKVWWKCSVHNKRSLGTSHIILMGLWCEEYELFKEPTTCTRISAGIQSLHYTFIPCLGSTSVFKFQPF